jgi:anti-sigma factor RsiW
MVCNEKMLVLFYYGELSGDRRHRVEAHLKACADCRARLARLAGTLDALPSPTLELSADDRRRLTARVMATAAASGPTRRWVWGGALAAAAALVVTLVVRPGGPGLRPGRVTPPGQEIGLLQDMEMMEKMELLENLDLLQELEQVG